MYTCNGLIFYISYTSTKLIKNNQTPYIPEYLFHQKVAHKFTIRLRIPIWALEILFYMVWIDISFIFKILLTTKTNKRTKQKQKVLRSPQVKE